MINEAAESKVAKESRVRRVNRSSHLEETPLNGMVGAPGGNRRQGLSSRKRREGDSWPRLRNMGPPRTEPWE